VVILAVGAVVLLFGLVVGGSVTAYFVFFNGSTVTPAQTGPRMWYVSQTASPDPNRTLKTLRGAWDQVAAGDSIVILDDQIDDPLVVLTDPRGTKRGVQVRAGTASGTVRWAPRSPSLTGPALQISNVDGLTVSGLDFEIDNKAASGIALGRGCAGVTIERVTVKNPLKAGFQFVTASGDPTRPIKLINCRIVGSDRTEAGIQFATTNRHVKITNCRIEGPGQRGILIEGSTQDVEIRNNRIYQFATGVAVLGPLPPNAPLSLTLTNNTFHSIKEVGILVSAPLTGSTQSIVLERNYFAATGRLVSTADAKPKTKPNLKAANNACEPGTREGTLAIGVLSVAGYALPRPNPEDAGFLFPAPGPLDAVGPAKVLVGARPE
jgi:hypothetical protein